LCENKKFLVGKCRSLKEFDRKMRNSDKKNILEVKNLSRKMAGSEKFCSKLKKSGKCMFKK
jgi:hypothetical protein